MLDAQLSEELIEEGFVREIISKVQTMRKYSVFEVKDNSKEWNINGEKVNIGVEKQ